MLSQEGYKCDLFRLREGLSEHQFCLDEEYFRSVEKTEVSRGSVQVSATLNNAHLGAYLDLTLQGEVTVTCDRCLDPMTLPVSEEQHFNIAFGDDDDVDDTLITISTKSGLLDIAWIAYETVIINLPLIHCHQEGECNPLMQDLLQSHLKNIEEEPEDIL